MPKKESKEKFNRIYQSRSEMLLNNFLGGIAWSLGTLVGTSVVIAILGFFLSKINLIPMIGSWITQIIEVVNQYKVK